MRDVVSTKHPVPLRLDYDRQKRIWEARTKDFKSLPLIAQEEGISVPTVQYWLRKMRDEVKWILREHVMDTITEQVAMHTTIVQEAMQGWNASKTDGPGEPKYLDTAMRALKHVRDMTGTDSLMAALKPGQGRDGAGGEAETTDVAEQILTFLAKARKRENGVESFEDDEPEPLE